MNRVVVTGIGLATPLGLGRERTWQRLIGGESAIAADREFPGMLSARVAELDVPPPVRLLSLAFFAAAEALHDSGLDLRRTDRRRIGCTVSASKPNLSLYGSGRIRCSELFLPSALGSQLRRIFGMEGPSRNVAAACATGAAAVILGAQWIRGGLCDVVVTGAAETSFHPLYCAGFRQMGVLAGKAVRPFDRAREGFALGEGAGILVLENREHALKRGAPVYGEVSGYALACDAHEAVSFHPSGRPIAAAVRNALAGAGRVDYINAHGTATTQNDIIETRAIRSALGTKADRIPVSSTKAATGHLLGASGAVEIAFCLLALRDQVVPPTLNLDAPAPGCDLDYVPRRAREAALEDVLSLSFGFGGQIAALAARKDTV